MIATNIPIYIFCSSFTNWGALIEHYVDKYPFDIEKKNQVHKFEGICVENSTGCIVCSCQNGCWDKYYS